MFYTVATRPEYRLLSARFFVENTGITTLKYSSGFVAPLCPVFRELFKVGTNCRFAIIEEVDAFGGSNSLAPSFGTSFSTYSKEGRRPLSGALYFRDVVRFKGYPSSGRTSSHWFHGMLDERDIAEDRNGERFVPEVDLFAGRLLDWKAAYNCNILDHLAIVPGFGGFSSGSRVRYPAPISTSHYVDAHAKTRWRRRVKGAVADAGESIGFALEKMFTALEDANYWLGLGIRIAPGSVYDNIVEAIGSGKPIHQAVKAASEAGQPEDGSGGAEPVLRFGVAWAEILRKWKLAATKAEVALPDLIAAHPTQEEGGDTYISSENLYPYVELLTEVLEEVSITACCDWFNPKSYQGQLSEAERMRLPDIIELSF
jgi:hypothetical protein